jgi:large subunit ribosomal protein L25
MHQIRGGGFFSSVYEIEAEGNKHRVLPRDIQLHPVTDQPLHIDFMRFSKSTRLVVEVPVVFVGEEVCPGLRQGGVLNIVRHAIEMRASPDNIPESIEIDLSSYNIGDSVHISSVRLPNDVELTIVDRDFTVVTIAAPTVNVEVTESDEEEAITEVAPAEETTEE